MIFIKNLIAVTVAELVRLQSHRDDDEFGAAARSPEASEGA